MNRLTKASGLALIALLALTAPAFAQADIGGEWTMSVASPDGMMMTVLANIEQEGEDFSGVLSSDQGDMSFSGGKISGNTIAFLLEIDMGGQFIAIEVEAEVEGDEMKGEFYVAEFGSMPFTATRGE